MTTKKFTFNVTQVVEVEIDLDTCNEEFMQAFSEHMWHVEDVSEIAEHIARQEALFGDYPKEFVPANYKARVVDEFIEEDY